MNTELSDIEKVARQLEPGEKSRQELITKIVGYINEFLTSLPEMPAYQQGIPERILNLEVGEKGKSLDSLLSVLEKELETIGINAASGRHLGYIPGGGIWTAALADFIAASTNRYAGVAYASPPAVAIENKMIQWMSELVGYPDTAHGNLSSGGSVSNQIAIQAARDARNIGAANVRQSTIYFTPQVHHCVHKAFHTTGLHEAVHRQIPMTDEYRMDTDALAEQLKRDTEEGLVPVMVIATAGTTDTGAIDPLDRIADLCQQYEAWFHVDAAYGGFFMLSGQLAPRFRGIERSDSLVMDPHKTLFLPYGSGVVLVRDRRHLFASNQRKAAYMKDTYGIEDISPADTGPELSKHFRGLRMWLPLHYHGLEPFRANLTEKHLLCLHFRERMQEHGFEVGPVPDLSVTIFRLKDDPENKKTQALVDSLHEKGTYFFSSTLINGVLWIRCAIASFRTHQKEVEEAVSLIVECSTPVRKAPAT